MSTPPITTEAIIEILEAEVSHLDSIDNAASFRADLELDSLDLSLFFLNIQEAYGVEISDSQAVKLDSINDVVEWLKAQAG